MFDSTTVQSGICQVERFDPKDMVDGAILEPHDIGARFANWTAMAPPVRAEVIGD